MVYEAQGRYGQAESLYKRDLAISEKKLGPDHPEIATTLSNLAVLYGTQGRYVEAESLHKRALAIEEKKLGLDHPGVATTLNNLAALYLLQGQVTRAEQLYRRTLTIREKKLGSDHPHTATPLRGLAFVHKEQGRYTQAAQLFERTLAIEEKRLGPNHISIAGILNELGWLNWALGHSVQAELLLKRSLSIREKVLGTDHISVANTLSYLALIYKTNGPFSQAESLYKRALAINEKALGADHVSVARSFFELADLYYVQKQWNSAYENFWKGTQIYTKKSRLEGALPLKKDFENVTQGLNFEFKTFLKAAHRLSLSHNEKRASIIPQTFERIQWSREAGAGAALSHMAVRFGSKKDEVTQLVRERQDLLIEWQNLEKKWTVLKSQNTAKANKILEQNLQFRLKQIEKRITKIDATVKKKFPSYVAFANPAPLSVTQVQKYLRKDEALIYFVSTIKWHDTPGESFIWLVTKTDVNWARSSLGTHALIKMVVDLRCGLDRTNWIDPKHWQENTELQKHAKEEQGRKYAECIKLRGVRLDLGARGEKKVSLPFDEHVAHTLYKGLFGQFEQNIKGKKLLLVPSGILTELPFQVLVTEKPYPGNDYHQLKWLINGHDLTVLPSVASLKVLRGIVNPSQGKQPFFGIGNPLLFGPTGKEKRAWEKQICNFNTKSKLLNVSNYIVPKIIPHYVRGTQVDLEALRRQSPLPETADELCAVAKMLGATPDSVKLGARATETNIKEFSAAGILKEARVIHFATHGLLTRETKTHLKNKAQPSLMLTPPEIASEKDDGLLTASEIAQLNLDADLVILSACNTAAGNKPIAEALSGLAKAFFYAGARALLVSHWYVNSDATVKLITKSFEAQKKDPKLGRAAALRAAMLDLIKSKKYSHPEYWAPFIVVGEGR